MGMIVTGPWAIAEIREANVNYGFTKIPLIDGKAPRPFVGVQGFMISSFSKNKMLAKAFLNEYIATEATMKALFDKDPRPAAHLAVAAKITDPDIVGARRQCRHRCLPFRWLPFGQPGAMLWSSSSMAK